jgi:hypothetical protein
MDSGDELEGVLALVKRGLVVSTNDFLTSLRPLERTLTHQYRKAIDEIEQEKIRFLFLIASSV